MAGGQTNEQTDKRTKVPLCSIGLCPLRGRCPKNQIQPKPNRPDAFVSKITENRQSETDKQPLQTDKSKPHEIVHACTPQQTLTRRQEKIRLTSPYGYRTQISHT